MESVDNKFVANKTNSKFNEEIHTEIVRAGKRTYFFDVKSTRNKEYYLTITESKKRYSDDGNFRYEKHKLFLYKEDFDKFADSLQDVINFIRENQPEQDTTLKEEKPETVAEPEKPFSDIDFEDI